MMGVTSGAGTAYLSLVFSRVRVARSLVFCVVFYKIVVCPFVLFPVVMMLSVLLLFMVYDYLFGIFKLFSCLINSKYTIQYQIAVMLRRNILDCLFLIAPSVFSNVYFLLPHSKALKTYHCHFISFQSLEKLEIFVYIDLIYNTLLYITS
jgi:hypothetical protein